MTEMTTPPRVFRAIGGNLALDFANTIGNHLGDTPLEYLKDGLPDLVEWCRQMGVVDDARAQEIMADAHTTQQAEKIFEGAKELREVIYQIFAAVATKQTPNEKDIAYLNKELAATPVRLQIQQGVGGYQLDWQDYHHPGMFLGPIARAAANLLASAEVKWVRQCADDECGWLFLDTTKNHSRRWCDMNDCGGRAKAKRHYQRSKQRE